RDQTDHGADALEQLLDVPILVLGEQLGRLHDLLPVLGVEAKDIPENNLAATQVDLNRSELLVHISAKVGEGVHVRHFGEPFNKLLANRKKGEERAWPVRQHFFHALSSL